MGNVIILVSTRGQLSQQGDAITIPIAKTRYGEKYLNEEE